MSIIRMLLHFRNSIIVFAICLGLALCRPQTAFAGPLVVKSSAETDSDDALSERLKTAKKAIRDKQVGYYGMVPVYPCDLEDGTYPVTVESTSVYFKIPEAELTVSGNEMSARITIGSLSYAYVYIGTAEEAEQADPSEWIGYEENDGRSVFTIPAEALNKEIPCAASSTGWIMMNGIRKRIR